MNVSSATMMSSLPKRMNLLAVALLAANLAGLASADLVFSAGFSDNSVLQRSSSDGALKRGSVALSLCTAAHLLYTRFANRFGTSISEATRRPNPRRARLRLLGLLAGMLTSGGPPGPVGLAVP
jgi:hypothetical protein